MNFRRPQPAGTRNTAEDLFTDTLIDFDPFNDQFRSLLERAQDRARKIQILERAVGALSRITASGDGVNLEELLRPQLKSALELCDMLEDGKGLIQLVENRTDGHRELVVHSHYGQKITKSDLERLPLGLEAEVDKLRGITAVVATTGMPIRIEDLRTHPRRKQFVHIIKNTRSALTIPLKVGRVTIGVLDLEHSKPSAFSVEDEYWVGLLAQLISFAIHTMFQYRQLRGFRELLTLTSKQRDLKKLIPALNKVITRITGAETIIIFTLDPKDPNRLILEKENEIRIGGRRAHDKLEVRFGEGVSGRAAALKTHIYVQDARELGRVRNGRITDRRGVSLYREYIKNTRSNWGEPLLADKQVIGVLNLESPRPHAFDALSPDVMDIVASGVSIAIRQDSYMTSLNETADLLLEADKILREHYVLESLAKLHSLAGTQLISEIRRLKDICPAVSENEEAVEILDRLQNAIHELSRDTRRLTQLTRAEAGLETTLLQALTSVEENLKLRSIKVRNQFNEEVGSIPVRGRLDLILRNILENAERHVGRGTVWIRAEKGPEKVDYWIRDDGPGIPKEKLATILDFGVTGGTDTGGSGMGLSISDWCVRRATGQKGKAIEIDSKPGKGTIIHFWLPRLHPAPSRRGRVSRVE